MCLYNNKEDVIKFLKESKRKKKKFVWCYKRVILKYDNSGLLHFVTPYQRTKISPGWFISNSRRKKYSLKNEEIGRGIHVFNSKTERWLNRIYLKVKAYIKDLIGVDNHFGELCFKKIHISKTEYNKVLKRYEKLF